MDGKPLAYDIMTTQSTYVRSLTRRIKGAISFVNQAATASENLGRPAATKLVKVDGKEPSDPGYPFFFEVLPGYPGRTNGSGQKV